MGGAQGQATDIEITAKQIVKMKEKLNQIIADHTGQPLNKVVLDTDRDFYLTAEEAKKYGLIDEVIGAK
jgi:ATP-dependent Clp protease protease subunit